MKPKSCGPLPNERAWNNEKFGCRGSLPRNVREYIMCSCQFADTRLTREKRLLLVECNGCGTKTSVKEIVVGFRADTSRWQDR